MAFIINRSSRSFLTSVLNHSSKFLSSSHVRYTSSQHRPMMLMDLPRVVYPNLFYTIRNLFSRFLITGYFDSTFAMKPFSEGARQALTVVSRLIANNQFEELSEFATQKAIAELKENYKYLTAEQKQKLPVDESEIVFSYPYLIGMIMDEQTNSRLVEITMIFHVLKDRKSYHDGILNATADATTNWAASMKKMRDNIVVCNYKFLRDMSKNSKDDSWIISGLNHWLPSEYEK
ncbi:unnamed protein product [Rotaria magnacalcarata]|uniref:Tim44-like domain-containing protein n=2 Tax=Rotaria magnacalcarata TaxID=392030 RepID=A0A816SN66_9BILA|nr:unnamed protein product [Rotaria magnacalcarata]CAF2086966.1 unnamed protein product [Rotaria magnacalcarata]CAF2108249.1 unnamed protein product [Rotaria magnacalcarata]